MLFLDLPLEVIAGIARSPAFGQRDVASLACVSRALRPFAVHRHVTLRSSRAPADMAYALRSGRCETLTLDDVNTEALRALLARAGADPASVRRLGRVRLHCSAHLDLDPEVLDGLLSRDAFPALRAIEVADHLLSRPNARLLEDPRAAYPFVHVDADALARLAEARPGRRVTTAIVSMTTVSALCRAADAGFVACHFILTHGSEDEDEEGARGAGRGRRRRPHGGGVRVRLDERAAGGGALDGPRVPATTLVVDEKRTTLSC